jgi:hypothetical protein
MSARLGDKLQNQQAECSNNCANNPSDLEPLAPSDTWTVLKKKSEVPCARTVACR